MNPWFADFDKMFEDFGSQAEGFVPAIDVYEDKDNVLVETPLPGVDPDKVNISVENDVLTIEGASEKKSELDEKNYYRKEVRSGSFHRAVMLPATVQADKAQAEFDNGMLKIVLPKEKENKSKSIKINVKK